MSDIKDVKVVAPEKPAEEVTIPPTDATPPAEEVSATVNNESASPTTPTDAASALEVLNTLGASKKTKAKARAAKHVKEGDKVTGNKENWTPEYSEARRLLIILADRRKKLGLPKGIRILKDDKFVFKNDGDKAYATLDAAAKEALLNCEKYVEGLLDGSITLPTKENDSSTEDASNSPEA